jgi:CRP/FNR family transcriptional regulator
MSHLNRSIDIRCETCHIASSCTATNLGSSGSGPLEGFAFSPKRVIRGDDIIRVNDSFTKLFFVRFGQFKMSEKSLTGTDRVVRFLMPGDIIGLDAIASGKHNFRVTALENSEACEIIFSSLATEMRYKPNLQSEFMRTMSLELVRLHTRASILSHVILDERLDISGRASKLGLSPKKLRLSMSRSDIASYLGTTIETVSRVIARFNQSEIGVIAGRDVEIYDTKLLMKRLVEERT